MERPGGHGGRGLHLPQMRLCGKRVQGLLQEDRKVTPDVARPPSSRSRTFFARAGRGAETPGALRHHHHHHADEFGDVARDEAMGKLGEELSIAAHTKK